MRLKCIQNQINYSRAASADLNSVGCVNYLFEGSNSLTCGSAFLCLNSNIEFYCRLQVFGDTYTDLSIHLSQANCSLSQCGPHNYSVKKFATVTLLQNY